MPKSQLNWIRTLDFDAISLIVVVMGLLSILKKLKEKEKEVRILML